MVCAERRGGMEEVEEEKEEERKKSSIAGPAYSSVHYGVHSLRIRRMEASRFSKERVFLELSYQLHFNVSL